MPNYNSTARVPFKTGGSVKKPKVKRIILWKGKAKDWPGAKEAARQTRNRKAEGGRIGLKKGSVNIPGSHSWWLLQQSKPRRSKKAKGGEVKKSLKEIKKENRKQKLKEIVGGDVSIKQFKDLYHGRKFKKGGKADKNWIQGVNKSIKARGTKGVCTGKKFGSASCKPGSRRYNLAKTFKKMARSKHASGGLVRYI